MRFVRRASPLHATRAGVGALWCCGLATAALTVEHPVVLAVLAAVVVATALGARVGRETWAMVRLALPIALLFALINPFVVREGVTVFFRLGELPPFGQIDLTLEAVWWGLQFSARLMLVLGIFSVLTCAVDPDGLLRAFRRISLRSALSASLAVRLVPVLARDGRRLADAQRLRGRGAATGRRAQLAVLRAVTTSALDRAMDVAATLEVRGYGAGRRPARRTDPWTRHDLAFLASALALIVLTIAPRSVGLASMQWYPRVEAAAIGEALALGAALALVAMLPFCDRRGIEP